MCGLDHHGGAPYPEHHHRRPDERQCIEDEDCPDVGHRQQQPGNHRADEEAETVDRARCDVRSGQLGRIGRKTREQRSLRRPKRQPDDAHEYRQDIDGQRRPIGEHDGRCGKYQDDSNHVRADHQPASVVPVGQNGQDRGEDRHRDEARHAEQAECGGATVLIGVDAQRHAERPVADHRSDEGEIDAPERWIAENAHHRQTRLGELLTNHRHVRVVTASPRNASQT